MTRTRSLRRPRGLTLLEVVAGIIIVGALAGVTIPTYLQHVRAARATAIATQLRALARATQRFHQDTGKWPTDVRHLHTRPVAGVSTQCSSTLSTNESNLWNGPYLPLGTGGVTSIALGDVELSHSISYSAPIGAGNDAEGGSARLQFSLNRVDENVWDRVERMFDAPEGAAPTQEYDEAGGSIRRIGTDVVTLIFEMPIRAC